MQSHDWIRPTGNDRKNQIQNTQLERSRGQVTFSWDDYDAYAVSLGVLQSDARSVNLLRAYGVTNPEHIFNTWTISLASGLVPQSDIYGNAKDFASLEEFAHYLRGIKEKIDAAAQNRKAKRS